MQQCEQIRSVDKSVMQYSSKDSVTSVVSVKEMLAMWACQLSVCKCCERCRAAVVHAGVERQHQAL